MPVALRERPLTSTVLREHEAVVPLSQTAAFEALARHLTPAPGVEVNFLVDPETRLIVVQGGWWYRGEYRVFGDPAGSRVTFTLVNVAPTFHWAGPITGRAEIRNSERAFAQLAEALA